jgi:type II secretory pathway pseudopilin PulG
MGLSIVIGKRSWHFKQLGLTYLAVLFLVAVMGAIWAAIGGIWSVANQREKEKELLLIGAQFREAIGQYYEKSPGALKRYPGTLEELLKDERQLGTQRYLRKVFIDPMTKSNKWGLVMSPMGGVMGVHSLSDATPIKNANFKDADFDLLGKVKYSEWLFVYRPAPLDAPVR